MTSFFCSALSTSLSSWTSISGMALFSYLGLAVRRGMLKYAQCDSRRRLQRRQHLVNLPGELRLLVDHGLGVIHGHAVSAGVLAHDRHHGVVGVPARPVALPLEYSLLPRHRHHAGLD